MKDKLYDIKHQEEVLARMIKANRKPCAIHNQRNWIAKLKKELNK